jgi:hypothetical protein
LLAVFVGAASARAVPDNIALPATQATTLSIRSHCCPWHKTWNNFVAKLLPEHEV